MTNETKKQYHDPVPKCLVEMPTFNDDGTEKDSDYWIACLKDQSCPIHSPKPEQPNTVSGDVESILDGLGKAIWNAGIKVKHGKDVESNCLNAVEKYLRLVLTKAQEDKERAVREVIEMTRGVIEYQIEQARDQNIIKELKLLLDMPSLTPPTPVISKE